MVLQWRWSRTDMPEDVRFSGVFDRAQSFEDIRSGLNSGAFLLDGITASTGENLEAHAWQERFDGAEDAMRRGLCYLDDLGRFLPFKITRTQGLRAAVVRAAEKVLAEAVIA